METMKPCRFEEPSNCQVGGEITSTDCLACALSQINSYLGELVGHNHDDHRVGKTFSELALEVVDNPGGAPGFIVTPGMQGVTEEDLKQILGCRCVLFTMIDGALYPISLDAAMMIMTGEMHRSPGKSLVQSVRDWILAVSTVNSHFTTVGLMIAFDANTAHHRGLIKVIIQRLRQDNFIESLPSKRYGHFRIVKPKV